MSPAKPGVCPVCQARFRSSTACSRCGADLTALMQLTAHSYRLRQQARDALHRGDIAAALNLIGKAQKLQNTPQGRSLRFLAQWLAAS
jgi:predicted amidophosphoribosyltransferase